MERCVGFVRQFVHEARQVRAYNRYQNKPTPTLHVYVDEVGVQASDPLV